MRHRVRDLLARVRHVLLAPLLIFGMRLLRREPTPFTMRLLYIVWSNSWAAQPDYLMTLAARIKAHPPRRVLECGSGLTTLILGELARNGGFTVVALEDDDRWATRIQRKLDRFDLGDVRVTHAPMKTYEAFSWYSPPVGMHDHFDLVVCDGPPSGTWGGRYGLLPVLHDQLAGATVLVDDADTKLAMDMLDRWREEFDADVVIDALLKRGLAIVTLPASTSGSAMA